MARPIKVVIFLRKLPHSPNFKRHLDNCSRHHMLHTLGGELPPLSWWHVLKLKEMPPIMPTQPRICDIETIIPALSSFQS